MRVQETRRGWNKHQQQNKQKKQIIKFTLCYRQISTCGNNTEIAPIATKTNDNITYRLSVGMRMAYQKSTKLKYVLLAII